MLTPLLSLYLGVSPIISTLPEILYYGMPFLLLLAGTTAWASEYHSSFFFNQVYETIFCFPGLRRLFITLRNPFGKGFAVTPKGVTVEGKNYNLRYTWPLLVVMALTVIIISLLLVGHNLGLWEALTSPDFGLVLFWLIYNFVIMCIAVLAAIDQPERRLMDRFPLRTACKLTCGNREYWGCTNNVSESGANLTLLSEGSIPKGSVIVMEFLEHGFSVEAKVVQLTRNNHGVNVSLHFSPLTIEQSRHLIDVLYTDLTWWKRARQLGGVDSFLAIFWSFLKLRPLLTAYKKQT
jgi:cellulose synthase (UDP-forming)